MLGYITINRDQMKVKDLKLYQAFYCGICQDIKDASGQLSRFTLSYDMTFLAILLTSLYGGRSRKEKVRCPLHPLADKMSIRNSYTAYAADMCLLLTYHNLMDDWIDDKNRKSALFAGVIRRGYKKTAKKYPRQTKAIISYIKELHKTESLNDCNPDLASGLTGRMLAEIFCIKEQDPWNRELSAIGFYLGKFIYLMDAYDDVQKDREKGNYNPLIKEAEEENFNDKAREILEMMVSSAAIAFERLPIVDYVDILRNILYSGVWSRFVLKNKKIKNTEGK